MKNPSTFTQQCFKELLFALVLLPYFSHAQSWVSIGDCGSNDQLQGVSAITTYGNDLYAAGYFDVAGGLLVANIAKWDGSTWSALGSGIPCVNYDYIATMAVYNGELYVGGRFSSAGGVPVHNIAKWNGSNWSAVGLGVTGGSSPVIKQLEVYNGKLYAAGTFDTAGNVHTEAIARWDGTSWSALPGLYTTIDPGLDSIPGITSMGAGTSCLSVYNGLLYIGGAFPTTDAWWLGVTYPIQCIATWNDTIIAPVKDTVNWNWLTCSGVLSMAVAHGKLYITGYFDSIMGVGPMDHITSFDGYVWGHVPSPIGGTPIGHLDTYSGDLIAHRLIGSGMGIGRFNGTSWNTLGGTAFTGTQPYYLASCEWNGDLYIGGSFSQVGSTPMMNIAKWTGTTGIEAVAANYEISLYPNPASETITIKNLRPNESIIVSNIVGQILISDKADANGEKHLDVSRLTNGLYFINNLKFVKN